MLLSIKFKNLVKFKAFKLREFHYLKNLQKYLHENVKLKLQRRTYALFELPNLPISGNAESDFELFSW